MGSLLPVSPKTFARAVALIASWPFFALLGAAVLLRRMASGWRRLSRARHVRREELFCARGHNIDVIGRWVCENCSSEYLGWIGACTMCGDESPDWTPCRCGLAVRLPWKSRS